MKNYLLNPNFIHWKVPSIHAKMVRDGAAYFSQTTFYNYARLHYLTPAEVLHGELPNKDRFKKEFELAKTERMEINRNNGCGKC